MLVHLRPARAGDEKTIKDLIRRTGINPFGIHWQRFTIAETESGQFAGCAQLKPHRDGSLELASLAVEEPFRGQGVARRLIEHLLTGSPRPLYLTCRAGLAPLYEKFGFRVITGGAVSPFFRRILFVFRLARFLSGEEQGVVMRIDSDSGAA